MVAHSRRSSLATALAIAAVLAGVAAPSSLAAGRTGSASEGGVTCYVNPRFPQNNRVIVQAPAMSSSPVAPNGDFSVGGGLFGGGYHVQQVGYRAWLAKWDGRAWRYVVMGPLRRGQTADALQPVNWQSYDSTVFRTPTRGAYAVFLRFYWFADAKSTGGTLQRWARVYEQGRARYCAF